MLLRHLAASCPSKSTASDASGEFENRHAIAIRTRGAIFFGKSLSAPPWSR